MPKARSSNLLSRTQQKLIKRLSKNELFNTCLSLTEELMGYRVIAEEARRRVQAEAAASQPTPTEQPKQEEPTNV
jgi:hypothetical protein